MSHSDETPSLTPFGSRPGSALSDVDLARTYAECGFSGQFSEWPQLRPLLGRLATRIETLEGAIREYIEDGCECPDCDKFRVLL